MRLAVVAIAGTLLVAGCGGSENDSETQSTSNTPAPAAASGGSAAKNVKAAMKDFEFTPESVTVAAGGKVTWTDEDASNHNVKFETKGAPEGIGNLNENESGSVTFKKPGTYKYVCTYHPNMHGTVVVR